MGMIAATHRNRGCGSAIDTEPEQRGQLKIKMLLHMSANETWQLSADSTIHQEASQVRTHCRSA